MIASEQQLPPFLKKTRFCRFFAIPQGTDTDNVVVVNVVVVVDDSISVDIKVTANRIKMTNE